MKPEEIVKTVNQMSSTIAAIDWFIEKEERDRKLEEKLTKRFGSEFVRKHMYGEKRI